MHNHDHTSGYHHHHHEIYADHPHAQHVVLELGDDVGALIVHADSELLGREVEISPTGHDDVRQHKEVLERVASGRSRYVLVFDSLAEGGYTLWIDGHAWARDVCVTGGEIAQLDRRRVEETALPAR